MYLSQPIIKIFMFYKNIKTLVKNLTVNMMKKQHHRQYDTQKQHQCQYDIQKKPHCLYDKQKQPRGQ